MTPDADADLPPSYAEATGTNPNVRIDVTRRSTSSAPFTPISSTSARTFPPAFSVYAKSPRHYFLGETHDSPLYAISTNPPYSIKPDVLIHRGLSIDMPALAAVHQEPFSRSATILLPRRPGSRLAAANERLDSAGAFTKVMSFSIETSLPGGVREHFEWRHSSGVEVEALGGRHSG